MPSNVKLLAGASGGEPTDANFKNVTLLLHGDGSNGAQNNTFIDSSTNNFTITRNGNTTQGSFSPYGSNWSNYFDGTGDYLTVPDSTALNLAGGTFTLEAWVYPNGDYSNFRTIISKRILGGPNASYQMYFRQTSGYLSFYNGSAEYVSSAVPTANAWNHVAAVYDGTNINLYLNGTRVLQTAVTITDVSASIYIGSFPSYDETVIGYLSNVRILKGVQAYTGSTYTVPTAPLTAISGTSLLTCAYNRFRDGSTNNFTITRNGDVKVTNFAPFAPSSAYSTTTNGGSAYFDGSGDYLSAPTNTALDCGTGNWTIECWTYISSRTNNYPVIFGNNRGSWTTDALSLTNSNADNASYNDKFVFGWNNGGFSSPSAGTSQLLVSNATNDLNTWYHFAVVRNGTSIKMYRNGVEVASATVSAGASFNWGYNGALVGGGNWDGAGSYYNGYISNLRLVKGTAVYTAAFTPPSSPVTAITNTSLLLNATNAAIFDNSMKNDLETVGNAQISTSVKKFGTGSIYLDGDDSLVLPANPALALDSGAFTIEAWVYPTTLAGTKPIIECRTSGSSSAGYALLVNSSGNLNVYTAGGFLGASSSALSANTWTHVALVRTGTGSNQTTYYINGTASGTITMSGSFTDAYSTITRIGASTSAGEFWPGYIDELRVTKGVARYTANFTAPTAPFPNK